MRAACRRRRCRKRVGKVATGDDERLGRRHEGIGDDPLAALEAIASTEPHDARGQRREFVVDAGTDDALAARDDDAGGCESHDLGTNCRRNGVGLREQERPTEMRRGRSRQPIGKVQPRRDVQHRHVGGESLRDRDAVSNRSGPASRCTPGVKGVISVTAAAMNGADVGSGSPGSATARRAPARAPRRRVLRGRRRRRFVPDSAGPSGAGASVHGSPGASGVGSADAVRGAETAGVSWPEAGSAALGRDRRSESDDGGRCDRDGPHSKRATHEGPLPLANEGRRQRPLLRSPFAVYGASRATSRRFAPGGKGSPLRRAQGKQRTAGLAGRAVLSRRAREREIADGVATDRARLPRAAVHAHGRDLRRLEPVDRHPAARIDRSRDDADGRLEEPVEFVGRQRLRRARPARSSPCAGSRRSTRCRCRRATPVPAEPPSPACDARSTRGRSRPARIPGRRGRGRASRSRALRSGRRRRSSRVTPSRPHR